MKNNGYIKTILVGLFTSINLLVSAQRFPVTTSIQLTPPYTTNLEEYASMATDRVFITAVFNDFSVPSFDVRFKFTIKSGNVTIQTNPNAVYEPIRLIPGELEQYTGFDLSEYFNINNLIVSGISQSDLLSGQGLPEGVYTFTVEVVDYRSGITISNQAMAMAPVFLNDPPQIVFPICGSTIDEIEPQNIQFQWLPMHLGSPNSSFTTEYELTLVEVPEGLNPEEAVRSALPTFQTTVSTNNFLYDVSAPLLENGKTYAYRVRAIDTDNLGLFKNDGFSDVCWFKFGFNTDGNIRLKGPENNAIVNGRNRLVFSWDAPNNLDDGQAHRYEYKIVKLEEGDIAEDAIVNKPSFHEERFSETPSDFGWSFTLPVDLDAESEYAWQVRANSKNVEIASSSPALLSSSPKISSFYAGSQQVKILTLENEDFSNLSGKGKIKLEEDGTEYEVDFTGLRLKAVAGRLILDNGVINFELPDTFKDISLTPDIDRNGDATFYPSRIRLDKRRLEIFGHVGWTFHLPQKDGEPVVITSDSLWMNYDVLKLNGPAKFHANNRFELLEPYDFQLNFDEESDFYLTNNFYKQRFSGEVVMPDNVASNTGNEVVYQFNKWSQLHYNTIDLDLQNDPVSLTKNTNINLVPETAVLDFSFEESGGSLGNDAEWIGLNYEKYTIRYDAKVDPNQLELPETLNHSFTQTTSADQKGWITNGGLQFEIDQMFDEETDGVAFFNEFGGSLKELKLVIEDSEVSEGIVKGFIRIPVITEDERFFYTLPVTSDGFEVGYLDEELEERYFSFNRYGGENKVDVTIKRTVFAENERLDLVIDVEIPALGVIMSDVADFRVYGDYFIGFGKRNGALPLAEQVVGEYDGFELFIDRIGASFANGGYAFSYSATMPLGEEFKGENGAPRVTMHSVEPLGDQYKQSASNSSPQNADLPSPAPRSGGVSKLLAFDSLEVNVESSIVDFNGYLILKKDDPDWGTSFQGGVNGTLKMPTNIGIGANLILGDRDATKYWYFDAWFVDTEGTGINVFEMFSLVGLEGRVFRHMSLAESQPVKNGRPNLVINPDMSFGAGIYMQLIDTKGGHLFKVDLGSVISVEEGRHFTMQMQGDVSMFNVRGRSAAAGGSLKKKVAKEISKEAAKKAAKELAAKALDDIDIEVPIGDLTFGLKSNDLGGAVSFAVGDVSFDFTGDLSGVPEAKLDASFAGNDIFISGNADAASSFSFLNGDKSVGISVDGNQSGSFDLGYDALALNAQFDRQVGSAGFKLEYEEKLIDLGANTKEGNGHLELQYGENQRMFIEADKAGKGAFEFELGDYYTSLTADKRAGTGSFTYDDPNNFFQTSINTQEGTASLKLDVNENKFDASIDRIGNGNLTFSNDNTFFNIEGDRTTGSGEVEFTYNSDNRFYASLQNANEAVLELQKGVNKIALAGNREDKSGRLLLENAQGRLLAEVNQSTSTGRIGIRYGQDSIYSAVLADSAILALAFDGKQLAVAAEASGKGYLNVSEGGKLLAIRADGVEESGAMTLQNGADRLFVSTNKSQQSGALAWAFDGKSMTSTIDPDEASFGLTTGDQAYQMKVTKAGQGELGIRKGDFRLGLAVDKSTSYGELELESGDKRLKIASDKVLDLNISGTELSFDPSGIGGPIILSEAGIPKEVPLDDAGNGVLEVEIGGKLVRFEINDREASFLFSEGNDNYRLSMDRDGNGTIGYETNGNLYALSQNNEDYTLTAGDYQLAYAQQSILTFSEGTSKSISISEERLKLEYDNQVIEFGTDKSLSYSNGQRSFAFSPEGVELKEGNRVVALGADKSLRVNDGNKSFAYANDQLEARYDQYVVTLATDQTLNFNDGVKNFDLSSEALSLSDGDKTVSIINQREEKELSVSFDGRSVTLSKEQFMLKEGDKRLSLGGENYFSYETGPKRFVVGREQIYYEEEDKKLAYGGDHFIELKDGDRSMRVTQEKALEIQDNNKVVRVKPDRSIEYQEDQYLFTLGGNSIASFTDGNSTVAINSEGRSRYGVSFRNGEYEVGLSTEKFKKAILDLRSPYGDLSLEGDANRNFTGNLLRDNYDITLKGGKQGISVEGVEDLIDLEALAGGSIGEVAEPELLEGTENPEMDGPLYIGKVTDPDDGRIKGTVNFYYNGRDRVFSSNGAVASTVPPCIDAAFAVYTSPNYWKVNIGSRTQKVRVRPMCSAFGGDGYFELDPNRVALGVSHTWAASATARVGDKTLGASLTASASATLGVDADVNYRPRFAINEATVWARATATLTGRYWAPIIGSDDFTLLSVDMNGNLTVRFVDRAEVSGRLYGRLEIIEVIKKDFDVWFEHKF